MRIRIPEGMIQEMKQVGAKVEKLEDEDLYVLYFKLGDDAFNKINSWIQNQTDLDPKVFVAFTPPAEIEDSVLCPSDALVGRIMREANSVIRHYSEFRAQDFANGEPAIGNVIRGVRGSNFHDATIALSKVGSAIQNCQYPTIQSLRPGSYVCDLIYTFAHTIFEVAIFKP